MCKIAKREVVPLSHLAEAYPVNAHIQAAGRGIDQRRDSFNKVILEC
jgi:hypothetical protein